MSSRNRVSSREAVATSLENATGDVDGWDEDEARAEGEDGGEAAFGLSHRSAMRLTRVGGDC